MSIEKFYYLLLELAPLLSDLLPKLSQAELVILLTYYYGFGFLQSES